MVMKFKKEPTEGQWPAKNDADQASASATAEFGTFPPVSFGHSPAVGPFKLNVTTTKQPPSSNHSNGDVEVNSPKPEDRGVAAATPSRLASKSHVKGGPSEIRIGFEHLRRCLLNLQLAAAASATEPQPCQAKFVNFLQQTKRPPSTVADLTRHLFCYFCLEASARVCRVLAARLHHNAQLVNRCLLTSVITSQEKVSNRVLRVRLIATCGNGDRPQLHTWSMVLLHVKCIRRGGKHLRERRLLGLVYSSERKDRRDRSGVIAIPEALAKAEPVLDFVDDVYVDVNADELEG